MKTRSAIEALDHQEEPQPIPPTKEERKKHFLEFFKAHDFESLFDIEDFNVFLVSGEPSSNRDRRIGLALICAYREDFEEHFGIEFTGPYE